MSINYKIGEYVYVELQNEREALWVTRIEEMQQQTDNSVQIKVKIFYRRKNIEESLIRVADKYMDSFLHGEEFDWNMPEKADYKSDYVKLHYKLLQRQVFISKETIVINPDLIRGKCNVFLLTTVDSPMSVLKEEDNFFFVLGYDAEKKDIHEDKGWIMIGSQYQADLPSYIPPEKRSELLEKEPDKDVLVWDPCGASDEVVNSFISINRSIEATKVLSQCRNLKKLEAKATQTLRDTHTFGALESLHVHGYNVNKAALSQVYKPITSSCTDELSRWTIDEVLIFERAIDKFGRKFRYIRQEFMPWKTQANMVRFYYQWKRTPRHKKWHKEFCSNQHQGDLKNTDIPIKPWKYPQLTGKEEASSPKCVGCDKNPTCKNSEDTRLPWQLADVAWLSWGPPDKPVRICRFCARYWKRYNGFIDSPKLEDTQRNVNHFPVSDNCPNNKVYRCTTQSCNKVFKTKHSLQRHQDIVHSNPSNRLFRVDMLVKEQRFRIGNKVIRRTARRPCSGSISLRAR